MFVERELDKGLGVLIVKRGEIERECCEKKNRERGGDPCCEEKNKGRITRERGGELCCEEKNRERERERGCYV